MARETIIRFSAVNIVVHPHPANVYEKLIRAAWRHRLSAQVHGERWGRITQVWESSDSELPGIHGIISTFTQIDPDQPWFNDETDDEASDADLNALDIPENLKPNLRRCRFILDEKNHILSFDMESSKGGLSGGLMEKFLRRLFSSKEIIDEFGEVKVTLLHPDGTIEDLLDIPGLREIFMHLSKPNPGDFDGGMYEDVMGWLDEQDADTLDQRISSSNGPLQPNKDTEALARVADENGYVEARGKQGNVALRASTKDSAPLIEQGGYNPNVTDETSASYVVAKKISDAIVERRRLQ